MPLLPYCKGVAFGRKSSLTVHLDTVHLERREHKCPDCPGVAFREKSTLTRHIDVVHLKRRDRACPYCPGVAFGPSVLGPRLRFQNYKKMSIKNDKSQQTTLVFSI